MLHSLSDQLSSQLAQLRAASRFRSCVPLEGRSKVHVTHNGESLVSFCSNDYLGLSTHPDLLRASQDFIATFGIGAGASRLVSGTHPIHLELESALASLVRTEAALLFPSGYQANIAVVSALARPGDLIVADRAIHASLIDGCRLSRAKLALFHHLDLDHAERHLVRHGPTARRRFLLTESLFSMDGDIAPLPALSALSKKYDTVFLVDEAHALGSLGPSGAGLCAHFSVRPDILVGTLGKALGVSGAFVAGSHLLREFLLNTARPFLFSTAQPPHLSAAALAAIRLVSSPLGDSLRHRLSSNASLLSSLLSLPPQSLPTPILPLILGSESAALSASSELRSRSFLVQPIRPPAVPPRTSRLRLTLSSLHTPDHISSLAAALHSLPPSSPSSPPPSPNSDIVLSPSHPLPIPGLALLGTDTSVGKTTVAAALLSLLTQEGFHPVPFKPVETGAASPSDADRLRTAASRPDLPLDLINPFSFPQPLAPSVAAATSGRTLSLPVLLSAGVRLASHGDLFLLETAGGLLTPYAPDLTSADLAASFDLPVLLVARNSLGTLNHTALAISEIRRRGLPLLGLILVHTSPASSPDQISNPQHIQSQTGLSPLGVLPFLPQPTPTTLAAALQQNVDLRPILSALSTPP